MNYRSFYGEPIDKNSMTFSTTDNFYSVEQEFREYEELMRENTWLKNEL